MTPRPLALSRPALGASVALALVAALAVGCGTLRVPMTPAIGQLNVPARVPFGAALLITDETKSHVFRGNPASFTGAPALALLHHGSARTHEFPLGESLEYASRQAFSQVFEHVTVVRASAEAKTYRMAIEPRIAEFHFRYDYASYAGFAIAAVSKVKVQVALASGDKTVWERTVESPEMRKGPWLLNFSYEKKMGEAASEALVFTVRQIASAIAKDAAIRQLAEN